MRSISSSVSNTSVNIWHSPLPYLFGGLGLMLLLIAVALIILACSYRKSSSSEQDNKDGGERPVLPDVDAEPKIVVIMAGDDKPTYLATPVITTSLYACTCNHSLQEQFPSSLKEGADP